MMAGVRWEIGLTGAHENGPLKVEVVVESVRNQIGGTRQVVILRDVAVEALLNAQQAQEVRRHFVRCSTARPLLE